MAVRTRIILTILIIFGAVYALRFAVKLPVPEENLFEEKNRSFSGVLRLWISDSESGIISWLREESTRFEKSHNGVYIQISPVSEKTLAAFSYGCENPPEMVVVSPGTLSDGAGLLSADACSLLRREFSGYSDCLTPVAMGGYGWAVRTDADSGLSLSDKKLFIPSSLSPFAAISLLYGESFSEDAPRSSYGVDLSLPPAQAERQEAAQTEYREIHPGADSRVDAYAYSLFLKGECDALMLSENELSSLLSASRAPEYAIICTGKAFTDRLYLFGITDCANAKPEKQQLCETFLSQLLSDRAQSALSRAKKFRVTDGGALYAGGGFSSMEQALTDGRIYPADPFQPPDAASFGVRLGEILVGGSSPQRSFDSYIAAFH